MNKKNTLVLKDCDFCDDKATVCVFFPGKGSICLKCVDLTKKVMGMLPEGAISCDKCGHFKTFRARTNYGASLIFEGRDIPPPNGKSTSYENQEKKMRYIVVGSNQTWAPGTKADHFLCGKCESKIPQWKVLENPITAEILDATTTKKDKAALIAEKKAKKKARRKKKPEPDDDLSA